jgi:predicted ribonuclease toxin of YeeF-YezG toxin-antitoxin module
MDNRYLLEPPKQEHNDGVSPVISEADKVKLDKWEYRPDDNLYLENKEVFDNPKYYNQETGEINWPDNDGFLVEPVRETLAPGTRIDRYGPDGGYYTAPHNNNY